MSPIEFASQIAYSSRDTLKSTYHLAQFYAAWSGIYVECGVAAGAQIIAMAHGAPKKKIYAFDSFEGIPLPSNRDDQMPGIRKLSMKEREKLPEPGKQKLESSGATVVSLEDFQINLTLAGINTSNIIPIKGWFEETVPVWAPLLPEIAMLRLDGDLYNSTYVCLEHLYPLVQRGGIVIIDDWHLQGCRDACDDYFHRINYSPEYLINDVATFVKQ